MQPAHVTLGLNTNYYARMYQNASPNYVTNKRFKTFEIVDIYGTSIPSVPDEVVCATVCHCHAKRISQIKINELDLNGTLLKLDWCLTFYKAKLSDLSGNDLERDFQAKLISKEIAYDMNLKREIKKLLTTV